MTEFLDPDHEIMGDPAGDLIDPDLDFDDGRAEGDDRADGSGFERGDAAD